MDDLENKGAYTISDEERKELKLPNTKPEINIHQGIIKDERPLMAGFVNHNTICFAEVKSIRLGKVGFQKLDSV